MTWPGPAPATIGFNADGSLFANYELSGTNNVHEVACQSYPDTVWYNLVYNLAIGGNIHIFILLVTHMILACN